MDIKELRKVSVDCYWPTSLVSITEILDRLETLEKERDALRAKIEAMEQQEPAGTLHDDGCFVWRETAPHQSNYAGWKMALYLAPGAKGEEK